MFRHGNSIYDDSMHPNDPQRLKGLCLKGLLEDQHPPMYVHDLSHYYKANYEN